MGAGFHSVLQSFTHIRGSLMHIENWRLVTVIVQL